MIVFRSQRDGKTFYCCDINMPNLPIALGLLFLGMMCGKLILSCGMADDPWIPKRRDYGPI